MLFFNFFKNVLIWFVRYFFFFGKLVLYEDFCNFVGWLKIFDFKFEDFIFFLLIFGGKWMYLVDKIVLIYFLLDKIINLLVVNFEMVYFWDDCVFW